MEQIFKSFRETPEGSIVVDGKRLTAEQFVKLQKLMPGVRWLGMCYPRPEDILNPSYHPSEDHATFFANYSKDPSNFLTFKNTNNQQ